MSIRKALILAAFTFISGGSLLAEEGPPGIIKRKYIHSCPSGTQQVGDGPPKSSIIFCRKLLSDGQTLEGDYISFYQNGNKKVQGEYASGKRTGKWLNFRSNGKLIGSTEYEKGKIIKRVNQNKIKPESSQYINQSRPFPDDREVFNKLHQTRTKKSNFKNPNIVYGISGK